MANNAENISINVEINASGQNQLNQYNEVFDDLRKSIDNLSNPISKLDADISKLGSSINQLGAQNNSFVDSISKINSTFLSLQDITNGVRIAFAALKTGALSLETALTGGLSLVLAFLPQITELISSFFKGKDAVSVMTNNLKNMNEVMKTASSNAAEEISKLNVLYKSATDLNTPLAERVKHVDQLRKQYPGLLKGMSDVDVANGKAKDNYNELTKAIIANAKAKAALTKIAAEEAKMLDADFQIEKIHNANYNEKKRRTDELTNGTKGGYRGLGANWILEQDKKDSDDRAKEAIDAQNQIKQNAQASIDFLMKYAGGAEAIAKTFMQNTANTADTTTKTIKTNISDGSSTPKPQKALQAQANQFAQRVETTKKQYEIEQANFDKQLDAQLISQESHNEQSKQLQEKLLADIGKDVKTFSEQSIAEALQYQQELVQAQKLGEDQDAENKAILPAQKLAAEKKLIDDKYTFEIQKAAEAGKDTAAIRMQYAQEMAEVDKKFAQERKNFELQTTQEVSNAAFSILQNSIKLQSEARIKQLETQKGRF